MYYLAVSGATDMTSSSSSSSDSRLTSCDGVTYTEKTGQGDETRLPPGFDIIYPVITKREQISRIYTFNNNTRVSTKHQTPNTAATSMYTKHITFKPLSNKLFITVSPSSVVFVKWSAGMLWFCSIYLSPSKKFFREEPSTQQWKVQLEQSINHHRLAI